MLLYVIIIYGIYMINLSIESFNSFINSTFYLYIQLDIELQISLN
jgi:hypothetical protein